MPLERCSQTHNEQIPFRNAHLNAAMETQTVTALQAEDGLSFLYAAV